MRAGPKRTRIPEDPSKKIIPRRAAAALFSRLRRQGKKIVFTNGCFDILHAGHARYLRGAAALGDVLVVGLNSDASVRRLKGKGRPVQAAGDRAYLLASLACVSCVVVFSEDTPAALIEEVVPHVLAKGGDWKGKKIVGSDFVRSRGVTVRTIRLLPGRSTTSILRRAGEVKERRS
ncbi:MAG: D-glycero-beta-D-manno-heptose 1-phosphate adenylyltransferase [Deltaproteobacteria bacterium]|nr:D-glycero-beta-D-manno-heptose 1-phosphate adenylyltransferase [Deltaproteobacteria bacterium]